MCGGNADATPFKVGCEKAFGESRDDNACSDFAYGAISARRRDVISHMTVLTVVVRDLAGGGTG